MLRALLFLIFIVFTVHAKAQSTGEVRGFVYDKSTGEAMIGAPVFVKGTTQGTATDVNGFYTISRLAPGTYTVVTYSIGFDTVEAAIEVQANRPASKNFYLDPVGIELQDVVITEKGTERKRDVQVSATKVRPRQIERIPAIGAEPDFAQYLQMIPGVIFTGDQGGQFYIRGGAPIQNKVMLDGMTIYNPFHSIGFFSVLDVDIIRSADVYTGGFGAQYGGRISAIMDIKTRDGNKNRFSGKLSASPFQSGLLFEGPVKKLKENEASSSFLINARTSYLEHTAPVFYGYADSNGLPYNFQDVYAKYSMDAPGGSSLNIFGFNYNDQVNFSNATNFHWQANGLGADFLLIPSLSSAVIEGNMAYSDYHMVQEELDQQPRESSISGFEMGMGFNYYIGKSHFKYGFDIRGFKTDFLFYNQANRRIQQTDFTTELGGYMLYKVVEGRWVLEPSLRLQYYASLQEMSPEPRLGLKYMISESLRLKFAGGLYSQNLINAQSDRDVVNLFYGFLSGPDDLPKKFRGQEMLSRLQKARHIIAGVEIDMGKHSLINIEGYYKYFNQLTNINRNKFFDQNRTDKPEMLRQDFIFETGDAYGFDVTYTYDKKPYYVYLVYSYGVVERQDELQTYYPHWDRRHNANVLLTYLFGKSDSWEASVRWNYGSGFPFTQTQGFYEYLDFQDGINTDYTTANGDIGILYADYNTGRLPDYHRMDVALKKSIKFTKTQSMEINLSVVNVYNRKNIFYFDRVNFVRVDQLPILPSLGLNYRF